MTEVMLEAPSAVSDRSHLYAFLTATDASATALERPVGRGWVGDYQISGKTGHVLANGAGYLLYVHIDERTAMKRGPSSRPWKNAKARLTFCKVTQDGDWEGCLHLDRLPTADEAVVIREVLGIRKRRHMTTEALSKLERTRGLIKSPNLAPHSDPKSERAAPPCPPDHLELRRLPRKLVPVGCSRPHHASLTDNTRYTDRSLGINGGPFLPSDNPAPKAVSVAL